MVGRAPGKRSIGRPSSRRENEVTIDTTDVGHENVNYKELHLVGLKWRFHFICWMQ
jgi:hypothetical protein